MADKWISVKNKKPPRAKDVLIYIPNNVTKIKIACYVEWVQVKSDYKWFTDRGEIFKAKEVSHWMPLPKAPKW